MHEQMGNFSREVGTIKKNKMEVIIFKLETKKNISILMFFNGLSSRLNTAEERISCLKTGQYKLSKLKYKEGKKCEKYGIECSRTKKILYVLAYVNWGPRQRKSTKKYLRR